MTNIAPDVPGGIQKTNEQLEAAKADKTFIGPDGATPNSASSGNVQDTAKATVDADKARVAAHIEEIRAAGVNSEEVEAELLKQRASEATNA